MKTPPEEAARSRGQDRRPEERPHRPPARVEGRGERCTNTRRTRRPRPFTREHHDSRPERHLGARAPGIVIARVSLVSRRSIGLATAAARLIQARRLHGHDLGMRGLDRCRHSDRDRRPSDQGPDVDEGCERRLHRNIIVASRAPVNPTPANTSRKATCSLFTRLSPSVRDLGFRRAEDRPIEGDRGAEPRVYEPRPNHARPASQRDRDHQ